MPDRSERRVRAALMVDEALDDVTWDEAIRRWSRADDERDPVGDAAERCQVELDGQTEEVVDAA